MSDSAASLPIVVDDRERQSGLPEALATVWQDVAVGRLPAGDIEIGARILIERKTVHDLVASLADGRLYSQAYALNGACHRPLIIVEGTDAAPLMNVPVQSLRGALLTLAIGYRIPVLRTNDVEETAAFVAHIAQQEMRRIERWASNRTPAPRRTPQRVAMDMLGSIPGVGDLRARQLVDRFGAVGAVLAASEAQLKDTPTIGSATARAVRRAAGPSEDGVREVAPSYAAGGVCSAQARRPPHLDEAGPQRATPTGCLQRGGHVQLRPRTESRRRVSVGCRAPCRP